MQLGSAFSYTVGSTLNIRVQATGTSPTTLRAKAWKSTQAEPASWQVSTTDSTAGLQAAGGVGVATFLSSTSTVFPTVSLDDLVVAVP